MSLTLRPFLVQALLAALCVTGATCLHAGETAAVEFCLTGEFDLGARFQGLNVNAGEAYPTRFCVITANDSDRVHFYAQGRSNADMDGDWAVTFLPEDIVRIVNRTAPPDIEFSGQSVRNEALRHRRMDPVRLVAELEAHPDWITGRQDNGTLEVVYPGSEFKSRVLIIDQRLQMIVTDADLPLRGRVPVAWKWQWPQDGPARARLYVDGTLIFDAWASHRPVSVEDAEAVWQLSGNQDAIAVPGDRWPARINMSSEEITAGVYLVSGVRTGFAHLVIDTSQGLIVADAPAGWVELHQIPASDLVPGLGISGLSENFIDFLAGEFPGKPIRAVAITHAHDDHAGGARAFAAKGADVYAPSRVAAFLQKSLNDDDMPNDQLNQQDLHVNIIPVEDQLTLMDAVNPVQLMVIPENPHVSTALGVLAVEAGVFFQSDLHVPNSEEETPRSDRAASECWFAQWAVDNLPVDTIVLNSHSAPRTPVSTLARYLESESCQAL